MVGCASANLWTSRFKKIGEFVGGLAARDALQSAFRASGNGVFAAKAAEPTLSDFGEVDGPYRRLVLTAGQSR